MTRAYTPELIPELDPDDDDDGRAPDRRAPDQAPTPPLTAATPAAPTVKSLTPPAFALPSPPATQRAPHAADPPPAGPPPPAPGPDVPAPRPSSPDVPAPPVDVPAPPPPAPDPFRHLRGKKAPPRKRRRYNPLPVPWELAAVDEQKAADRARVRATTPTRVATLPNDPFFARITAADLECPACGTLASFAVDVRGRFLRGERLWEPATQTFTCPACGHAYQLGVLAWTRVTARVRRPAADALPTPRQTARLRQLLAGGVWARGTLPDEAPINRELTTPCPCTPDAQTHGVPVPHPSCELHGPLAQTPPGALTQERKQAKK